MDQQTIDRIKANPKFEELCSKRSKLAWTLSAVMLVLYYAFILLIAFSPKTLATPIGPETLVTLGIPVGIGLILIAFALTGIYVRKANSEFDALTQAIKEETK
jgi:uncharacterized membrane protein (DUF485 family)